MFRLMTFEMKKASSSFKDAFFLILNRVNQFGPYLFFLWILKWPFPGPLPGNRQNYVFNASL